MKLSNFAYNLAKGVMTKEKEEQLQADRIAFLVIYEMIANQIIINEELKYKLLTGKIKNINDMESLITI